MIEIKNLSFEYGKRKPVYRDFSLTIERGGIYGLLGPNGAGKSTLIYLIAGLLKPDSGVVEVNGEDAHKRLPAVMSDLFVVPEEFDLPPISLEQFIATRSPFYPKFSLSDMHRHLETFELPRSLDLRGLSMGQKKKVMMCFALACNTSILLLDEPTNGLDIPGKSRFRKFIVSSMTDNRIILISTHQVRDIDRVLDHIIINTAEGRVVLNSAIAEITARLKFLNFANSIAPADALAAVPVPGGCAAVLPNTDGIETEINIETLFELAIRRPALLQQIMDATPQYLTDTPSDL